MLGRKHPDLAQQSWNRTALPCCRDVVAGVRAVFHFRLASSVCPRPSSNQMARGISISARTPRAPQESRLPVLLPAASFFPVPLSARPKLGGKVKCVFAEVFIEPGACHNSRIRRRLTHLCHHTRIVENGIPSDTGHNTWKERSLRKPAAHGCDFAQTNSTVLEKGPPSEGKYSGRIMPPVRANRIRQF